MKPRSVQQPDDPVEGARQRVGGGRDLLLHLGVLPLDAQVPLGSPDPCLAVAQLMGRVATQLLAQRRQLRVDVRPRVVSRPRLRRSTARQPGGRRKQRRRQIAAHPRLAVFDPLGQRHRPRSAPTAPAYSATKSFRPSDVRSAPAAAGRRSRGPASNTTARPPRRPWRIAMMSPRRSAASASLAAWRRCSRDARACARSRSVIGARSRVYSRTEARATEFGGDLFEHPLAALDATDHPRPPSGRPDTARTTAPAAGVPAPRPCAAPG